MQLNELVEKLPFFNRVNTVLVCEIDHLGLRAAAMQRHGEHLTISHEAHSDALDFNAAVAEVVTHVRQQGWVGKHAVLLTPAVLQSLIDLPIPPKNKLAPQQIAEQVRWELEPLISQHHSISAIGRMLAAHGYMTEEQIEDALSQQGRDPNSPNINISQDIIYKRFGEIVLELGYIKQAQLDKCLSRQAWLQSPSEAIQCGWSPQGRAYGDETGTEMLFQWLASAVNQSLLRQWQAAFTAQNVKLEHLYPLSGCAVSTLPLDKKTKKHQLLIEVHDTMLTGTHLIGDQVSQFHTLPNTPQDTQNNCSEMYHLLAHTEMDTVWLVDSASKNEVEANTLLSNLNRTLQQPVKSPAKPTDSITLGMMGAARHFMGMQGATAIAGVAVNEPLPPLLQRVEIRAMLAGMGLLLALGAAEVFLQVRHGLIAYENEKISADLKKIESAIARVQTKVDAVKKLKEEINNNQEDKKELTAALDLLSKELPKRNQIVHAFLNELDRAVSDDVVIDRIAEDPIFGFTVNAWALNEKSAQEFISTFQLAMQPLGFKLKDITVATQTGRLGLLGYSINFNATTLADDVWKAVKQSPNQTNPLQLPNTPASSAPSPAPSSPAPAGKPAESK